MKAEIKKLADQMDENAENVKVALELGERAARTVAAALQSYADSFNASDSAGRRRIADSELILGAIQDAIKEAWP